MPGTAVNLIPLSQHWRLMPQKDLKNGKILNLSSLASKETSATDPRSVKPEFLGVFFNRLGCSFNCDDHVHFYIFIRSSKYESFHLFQFTGVDLEKPVAQSFLCSPFP